MVADGCCNEKRDGAGRSGFMVFLIAMVTTKARLSGGLGYVQWRQPLGGSGSPAGVLGVPIVGVEGTTQRALPGAAPTRFQTDRC